MIFPIYTYGTRVLKQKAEPVRTVDEETVKLVMDMFDTMHAAGGIGLAANQIGKPRRVITVDISDIEETKEPKTEEEKIRFKSHPPIALINPEIIHSEGIWTMEEGCLSIPEVRDMVERAEKIKVRYKDTSFRTVELEADGLFARVILHEIDHLNGILFLDHVPTEGRKVHKVQLKKIQRGEIETAYPVITAASENVRLESTNGA